MFEFGPGGAGDFAREVSAAAGDEEMDVGDGPAADHVDDLNELFALGGLAIDFEDDIAGLQTGGLSWGFVDDVRDSDDGGGGIDREGGADAAFEFVGGEVDWVVEELLGLLLEGGRRGVAGLGTV